MKRIAMILGLLLSSFWVSAQTAPGDQVKSLRGNNGATYTFTTTGTADGSVWGGADGYYTDDSRLGKAAVHAGLLAIGQTGVVTIVIQPGRGSYRGSSNNGVATADYGAWGGSFTFGSGGHTTSSGSAQNAPGNMTEYRGRTGGPYTFVVTGTNDGSVWGGENGIYTDDSRLSTAAVQAGLVGLGQQATIRVWVLPGQPNYTGCVRNGISSANYGAWQGSYSFNGAGNTNTVGQTNITGTPNTGNSAPNTGNAQNAPGNMKEYRGRTGGPYTFVVTGTNDGSVWGGENGIYTDDSRLSTAAVQAGLVGLGQQATIRVWVLPGQQSYTGCVRNGISSANYGAWQGSYSFNSGGPSNPTSNIQNAPGNLTAYRGQTGTLLTFVVTGANDGSVWGGENGIYTDDSKLATAAVHAGLVSVGQQATIRVRILSGQASYKGCVRNGITTRDYGTWQGSYRFE